MGIIVKTFRVILALGMIIFGGLLIFFQFEDIYGFVDRQYEALLEFFPPDARVREIVAAAIFFVGTGIFFSVFMGGGKAKKSKQRTISFAGMHGEVSIELQNVERQLENVAKKLPEVRNMSIRLEPTDSPGRARVLADAYLVKNADDDARLVTARVQHFLQVHAKKILGLQDVEVTLKVKKFMMNMKTVKPEPLLLEGPDVDPLLAAVAAAKASQPIHPQAPEPEPEAEQDPEAEAVPEAVVDVDDDFELDRHKAS